MLKMKSALYEEQLYRFLGRSGNERLELELLAFWGRHPQSKFDRDAIAYALGCRKMAIDKALKAMVKSGLINTYARHGAPLYSLTDDLDKRRAVLELATLEWEQWQITTEQPGKKQKTAT